MINQSRVVKAQQNLESKKADLDRLLELERNKLKEGERIKQEASQKHMDNARKIFEDDKQRIEKRLSEDREIADKNMNEAKEHAHQTFENDNRRASEQSESEKQEALNELNLRKEQVETALQQERKKLDDLNESIGWHESRPWNEFHVKQALTALYPVRGKILAELSMAEETSKLSINLGEEICKGKIDNADVIYTGSLKTSQANLDSAKLAADQSHFVALETAKAVYISSMDNAKITYDQALFAADEVGKYAYHAYIENVDGQVHTAKAALDAAVISLEEAKIAVEQERLDVSK